VRATVLPEPGCGQQPEILVTTMLTFRDGRMDLMMSKPGPGTPWASPARKSAAVPALWGGSELQARRTRGSHRQASWPGAR
jgi:hypothetical protein